MPAPLRHKNNTGHYFLGFGFSVCIRTTGTPREHGERFLGRACLVVVGLVEHRRKFLEALAIGGMSENWNGLPAATWTLVVGGGNPAEVSWNLDHPRGSREPMNRRGNMASGMAIWASRLVGVGMKQCHLNFGKPYSYKECLETSIIYIYIYIYIFHYDSGCPAWLQHLIGARNSLTTIYKHNLLAATLARSLRAPRRPSF